MSKRKKPTAVAKDTRPTPGPRRRQEIARAAVANTERPLRASVTLEKKQNGVSARSPHTDDAGNAVFVQETLGTASASFANVSLGMLEWATRDRGADQGADVGNLNAALAMIGAIGPRDELEGALAVQMASCHALTVEMLGRCRHADHIEHLTQYGNLAVKLQRTFTAQIEALARMRGGANQSVRVEHVHVHEGGQAVVGNLTASAGVGGRGKANPEDQSHAKQASCERPALRSPDPAGQGVPIAGGEGQEAVPDARRHQSGRPSRK